MIASIKKWKYEIKEIQKIIKKRHNKKYRNYEKKINLAVNQKFLKLKKKHINLSNCRMTIQQDIF